MIRFITDTDEKKAIARTILEALPEWFEVEESREQYIRECVDWPFWAACEEDKPVGFLCLKQTGNATMELAVMGVLKSSRVSGTRQIRARSISWDFVALFRRSLQDTATEVLLPTRKYRKRTSERLLRQGSTLRPDAISRPRMW